MSDYPSNDEFTTQAQRLLRYRVPLVLGLLLNCALIARVPLSHMRAAPRPQVGQTHDVALDTTASAAPAAETGELLSLHTESTEAIEGTETRTSLVGEPSLPTDFVPVAAAPEVDATLPTPPGPAMVDLQPAEPMLEMPTLPPPARDFSWASEGVATGLSHLRDFWQENFGDVVHEQHLEDAAQAAAQPFVVEVPSADGATTPTTDVDPADDSPRRLELVNPSDSGGTVHFLIDGRACTLLMGESHSFPAETPHRIQFHRGGDFGHQECCLTGGTFQFQVGHEGWQLVPSE